MFKDFEKIMEEISVTESTSPSLESIDRPYCNTDENLHNEPTGGGGGGGGGATGGGSN